MIYKSLVRPANWQDFERLISKVYERKYLMGASNLYGRHGQAQNGVDTYFKDVPTLGRQCIAIQCKRYEVGNLTKGFIDGEHKKVQKFSQKVDKYFIITTDSTDINLQDHACLKKNPSCEIIFWESVESDIQLYEDILQGFYKEFVVYRDFVSEGNTPGRCFVLEFSGTKLEFLISKIPTYTG